MGTLFITPENALYYIDVLLALKPKAFQRCFQKMAFSYQIELHNALIAYQTAQQIKLPGGQTAIQTQWHRLNTLARKMNHCLNLLAAEGLLIVTQQQLH